MNELWKFFFWFNYLIFVENGWRYIVKFLFVIFVMFEIFFVLIVIQDFLGVSEIKVY